MPRMCIYKADLFEYMACSRRYESDADRDLGIDEVWERLAAKLKAKFNTYGSKFIVTYCGASTDDSYVNITTLNEVDYVLTKAKSTNPTKAVFMLGRTNLGVEPAKDNSEYIVLDTERT